MRLLLFRIIDSKPLRDNDAKLDNWEKVDCVTDGSACVTAETAHGGQDSNAAQIASDPPTCQMSFVTKIKSLVLEIIYDRLADFIEETETYKEEDTQDQPLAIKTLKENVSRFSDALQPFQDTLSKWNDIVMWTNPFFTLTIAMIFMYSAWYGLLVPLLMMTIVLHLSRNFLISRGFIVDVTSGNSDIQNSEAKDELPTSWSGRYQLVLSIAKKVQNRLGYLADALEKLQSLSSWRHMEATKKLWLNLLIAAIVSMVIPGQTVLRVVGVALGIKIFVISPIYSKFPKVKSRYDDVARLWDELPTRLDHLPRVQSPQHAPQQTSDAGVLAASQEKDPLDMEGATAGPSANWDTIVFCDRFGISRKEVPLPGWTDGKRCTLMNKDKPLANMKHGRLYLTKHFLCFERNQFNSQKNLALKLEDIVSIVKTKPFSILPGSGMAIEVKIKLSDKPYIFAAMVNRDEAYDGIMKTARAMTLPWATAPDK